MHNPVLILFADGLETTMALWIINEAINLAVRELHIAVVFNESDDIHDISSLANVVCFDTCFDYLVLVFMKTPDCFSRGWLTNRDFATCFPSAKIVAIWSQFGRNFNLFVLAIIRFPLRSAHDILNM